MLHSDLKTATTDSDDPTALAIDLGAASPAANSLLHRVARNPGNYFLELFQLTSGSGAISQAAIVRAFGWVPTPDKTRVDLPINYDATNFDKPDEATIVNPIISKLPTPVAQTAPAEWGYWIPLRRPEDGLHALTFSTTQDVDKDSTASSAKQRKLGDNVPDANGPRKAYVACPGCTQVLVTVSQAMVGPTAAMLLGRFTS